MSDMAEMIIADIFDSYWGDDYLEPLDGDSFPVVFDMSEFRHIVVRTEKPKVPTLKQINKAIRELRCQK
jgi:hypothetical protein